MSYRSGGRDRKQGQRQRGRSFTSTSRGGRKSSGRGHGNYGGGDGSSHHDYDNGADNNDDKDDDGKSYDEGASRYGGGRVYSVGRGRNSSQQDQGHKTAGRSRYMRDYGDNGSFGTSTLGGNRNGEEGGTRYHGGRYSRVGGNQALREDATHNRSGGFGRGRHRFHQDNTARDQRDGFGRRGFVRTHQEDNSALVENTGREATGHVDRSLGGRWVHSSGRGSKSRFGPQRSRSSYNGAGRGSRSFRLTARSGRGHYADSLGGRDRGADPPLTGSIEALSNILIAQPTPNFKFYRYKVAAKDSTGRDIESSSRRNQLLDQGIFEELLKDKSKRVIECLKRQTFFSGAFFFAATLLPGLETLPFQFLNSTDTALGTTTIESVQCFCAPEILQIEGPNQTILDQAVSIDFRCADCIRAFTSWTAIKLHCQETGHKPVTADEEAKPADLRLFIQYANVALKKAMGERMAPWGRHYVDPRSFTTPKNMRGQEMGVNVFQAYHVEFTAGLPTEGATPKLMLTVDLTAKVIRTKSLLHLLCRGGDPNTFTRSEHDEVAAKRTWIGEIVISKLDKACYDVHDLVFDESPNTMFVGTLGISHTKYFAERKNYTLNFPSVKPMVAVRGRHNKIMHLPAETICANELDDELKMKLPQITSFKPDHRNEAIDQIKRFLIPGAQKSKSISGLLPAIGIILSDERMRVPAEVLPAPIIEAAGIYVDPLRPNWASQIARAKFSVEPREVVELNVIVIHHKSIGWKGPYRKIASVINGFQAKYRFPLEPVKTIRVEDDLERHWGAVEVHFGASQPLPPNVFVVDFTKPRTMVDEAYPVVKNMFAKGGYLSQFVNFRKTDHERPRDQRRSDTTLGGVARQILTKAGVSIWWTKIPRALPLPAIFVGVDVYHSPRKYDPKTQSRVARPSVAAIVVRLIRDRSTQTKIECYSETFARDPGQEHQLGPAMEQTLSNAVDYLKISQAGSCILWRDGVSDSAISDTADQELPPVRRVLGEEVPLAMIVCQKRINTKFLSTTGGSVRGLPAGTLVQGVSNLNFPTFYLNGTSPPYSTPKPVRFLVAHRDDGLSALSLPKLTWQCCHDYPNWAGPIKLPAVTQLAHCLAEHAGNQSDSGCNTDHAGFVNHLYFL